MVRGDKAHFTFGGKDPERNGLRKGYFKYLHKEGGTERVQLMAERLCGLSPQGGKKGREKKNVKEGGVWYRESTGTTTATVRPSKLGFIKKGFAGRTKNQMKGKTYRNRELAATQDSSRKGS